MNVLTPLAIKLGGQSWLSRLAPFIVSSDRLLQRLTHGRVTLAGIAGLPELVLTVPGRKSGLPRTTPLLYVPHQGSFLVAGSNWGLPTPPAWALNLTASPDAEVAVNGHRHRVHARQALGEERSRLWEVMLRTWPNYARYAERTDREIPVFVLELPSR